ncbi:uncharacterized protein [Aristolochia californica]|uniref:uncharacterized protein n=1 Tax=Aristolochia californica TaxID=171875 RepID=UPI0035D7E421
MELTGCNETLESISLLLFLGQLNLGELRDWSSLLLCDSYISYTCIRICRFPRTVVGATNHFLNSLIPISYGGTEKNQEGLLRYRVLIARSYRSLSKRARKAQSSPMTRKKPRKVLPLPPPQQEEQQKENPSPRMSDHEEDFSHSQELDPSTHQAERDDKRDEIDAEVHEEQEGMSLSPTSPSPPAQDIVVPYALDAPPTVRRPGKRKKPMSLKERTTVQKKLRLLKKLFQPVPFTPSKTLDFSKHEVLFKRLGIWDFAHLNLDTYIRSDLLVALLANYRQNTRCSVVHDFRIKVSRPDLARALRLPLKKDRANLSELQDSELEPFSEESLAVVENFISNYMLLHEEDTWMMPDEIMRWIRLVKDGQPHKVDFAALMWSMVEKELLQPLQTTEVFCYYASHLQCLLKSQRPEFFKEETLLVEEDEDEENNVDMEVNNLEDLEIKGVGCRGTELSLGFDKNEHEQVSREDAMDLQFQKKEAMDFDESKDDNHQQWFSNGNDNPNTDHCLQKCNSDIKPLKDDDEICEQHENFCNLGSLSAAKDDEDKYHQHEKFGNLGSLSSANVIPEIPTSSVSYGLPAEILDPSSGELMTPRADTQKEISLNLLNQHDPSIFGSDHKRVDDESDVSLFTLNGHHVRMRDDGPWDQRQSGFDLCMDNMQAWLGKSKSMYEEKEQECEQAQMQIRALTSHLQQREAYIQSLEAVKIQEEAKREMDFYRLQQELGVMIDLLNGYKKALVETRRTFYEYREKFKQSEEPLYRDVNGSGGVVLTAAEVLQLRLEKEAEEERLSVEKEAEEERLRVEKEAEEERLRLEKEAEERFNCSFVEEELNKFEQECMSSFSDHLKMIDVFQKRLEKFEETTKSLMDLKKYKTAESLIALP